MILGKSDVSALALPPVVDEHGVKKPKARSSKIRARLSSWCYSENVPAPTAEELQAAREHQEHALHAPSEVGAIEGSAH